jgi:hypothetical protein
LAGVLALVGAIGCGPVPPAKQTVSPVPGFNVPAPVLSFDAWGRSSRTADGTWQASFGDMICREFDVNAFPDTATGESVNAFVQSRLLPYIANKGALNTTVRWDTLTSIGPAMLVQYHLPKSAPCTIQVGADWKHLYLVALGMHPTKQPDADVAMYVFYRAGWMFAVDYVRGDGFGISYTVPVGPTDRVLRDYVESFHFER